VNVGIEQVIEGLVLVACASLGMDSLHNRCFVLAMITQPQECAEVKEKKLDVFTTHSRPRFTMLLISL